MVNNLNDYKCKHCKKLLLKGEFMGAVEIKCSKCKNVTTFLIVLNMTSYSQ